MVLISGAAGKTGQAVLQALIRRGTAVRVWTRTPAQAERLLQAGAAEAVHGEINDPHRWTEAVRDVRAIYHICPNMHPREFEIGRKAVAAAKTAGVHHFVFHSVLHPQTETMSHHWQKMQVEAELFMAGIPFTILQPAPYMQNLRAYLPHVLGAGELRVPYPPGTQISMVDLQDVAAVAALVIDNPAHHYAIYELAAPGAPSQEEVAADFGRLLGRPVRALELGTAVWQEQAAGLPAYARETLLQMFAYYGRYQFRGNGQVLASLLGRPPTPLAEVLPRLIAAAE